jgi:hypothetical protein
VKYITQVLIFFVIVVCMQIAYAEVYFVPKKSNVSRVITENAHILISGEITEEDVSKLNSLLAQQHIYLTASTPGGTPIVLLNSWGGDITAALEIGRILRSISAWTIVDDGKSCSSACVFIFSAGVKRDIFLNGRLGLHSPRLDYSEFTPLKYGALINKCRNYMDEMGISNQVFSDMLQTPSQSINFVDRVYAESHGLVGIAPLEEWGRAKRHSPHER